MKKIILALFFPLQVSVCVAQKQKTNTLAVGDIIPDMEISNILNYSSTAAKISDFKGKLLILDFWATTCTPCIAFFPKLESLRSKFGDKLQILAVTQENTEDVKGFFENLKKAKNIPLPISATGDKKLSRLFFHKTVPHYVWIDGKGEVIAITGSEDVTEKNIAAFFKDGKFDYTLKKEEQGRVVGMPKFAQSVLIQKNNTLSETKNLDSSVLTIHTILTKYVDGIDYGVGQFEPAGYIFWGNCTILKLYQTALYGNTLRILNASLTNMLVEIDDSVLYKHITGRTLDGKRLSSGFETVAWLKENAYCYEQNVPYVLTDQKYKLMLDQLNLYFGTTHGIEGLIEKRVNKYLALVRTSKDNKIEAKAGEEELIANSYYLKISNLPINKLVNQLILPLQKYPMIEDETGFKENVTIELTCQLADLKGLNKELSKYDLQIVEKEKEMLVGVIRKKIKPISKP